MPEDWDDFESPGQQKVPELSSSDGQKDQYYKGAVLIWIRNKSYLFSVLLFSHISNGGLAAQPPEEA